MIILPPSILARASPYIHPPVALDKFLRDGVTRKVFRKIVHGAGEEIVPRFALVKPADGNDAEGANALAGAPGVPAAVPFAVAVNHLLLV